MIGNQANLQSLLIRRRPAQNNTIDQTGNKTGCFSSRRLWPGGSWPSLTQKMMYTICISNDMKEVEMSRVEEIKQAIDTLSENDYVLLRRWFSEKDWQKWDAQITADSESGKLDFLMKEALEAKATNKLREL
jgi:hypothetical protein